jgi:hypothetical protein
MAGFTKGSGSSEHSSEKAVSRRGLCMRSGLKMAVSAAKLSIAVLVVSSFDEN